MGYSLIVVGIGPGNPDYLLPAARLAIEQAQVLAGGIRALRDYAGPHQQIVKVDGDIRRLLNELRAFLDRSDVVVMVSGDPGYFSLLEILRRSFSAHCIRVIPGVSSFQFAFAKLGMPWQNARLVSAHGRQPAERDLAYEPGRPLSLLTDGKRNPARIAGWLLGQGWPEASRVWLCRNLSYEDENILATTLKNTLETSGFDSCVMVVMK